MDPDSLEVPVRHSIVRPWIRALAPLALAAAWACGPKPPQVAPQAAADSVAAAARRDSLAAASRRDSLAASARRDSVVAAARADSLARAAREAARADSVRAQVRANVTEEPASPASGLDAAGTAELAMIVRFAFNRSDIDAAAAAVLDRKLQLLQQFPRLALQVAGHCDERGSDEYNLALGERRAAAVKRYLVEHGVAEGRLTIASYGEERPLDPEHTEEAWARNRRAEFAVTAGTRP